MRRRREAFASRFVADGLGERASLARSISAQQRPRRRIVHGTAPRVGARTLVEGGLRMHQKGAVRSEQERHVPARVAEREARGAELVRRENFGLSVVHRALLRQRDVDPVAPGCAFALVDAPYAERGAIDPIKRNLGRAERRFDEAIERSRHHAHREALRSRFAKKRANGGSHRRCVCLRDLAAQGLELVDGPIAQNLGFEIALRLNGQRPALRERVQFVGQLAR